MRTRLSLTLAVMFLAIVAGGVHAYTLDVMSSPETHLAITSTEGHGGTTDYQLSSLAEGTNVQLTAPDADSSGAPFARWKVYDDINLDQYGLVNVALLDYTMQAGDASATAFYDHSAATRVLPASGTFASGENFTVQIILSDMSDDAVLGQVVEDSYPEGWSAPTGLTNSGSFDSVNRKCKWVFLDGLERTLQYTARPSSGAGGAVTFDGRLITSVKDSPIVGDSLLVGPPTTTITNTTSTSTTATTTSTTITPPPTTRTTLLTTTTKTSSTTTTKLITTTTKTTTTTLPSTYYVNDDAWTEAGSVCTAAGDDANDGWSPATPMRHVQALLNKYPTISTRKTVWVDAGAYVENISIGSSHSMLTLRGAAADETTLDGGGAGSCISLEGFSGTIRDLTIRNGYALRGGGIYSLNSSPLITYCTVSDNTATYQGGGMLSDCSAFSSSAPSVTYCTFSGNSVIGAAGDGGGMYNRSSLPAVAHCTFTGNSVSYSLGRGGAMCNSNSLPDVTSCTFGGNHAYEGGGIYNVGSHPFYSHSSANFAECAFSDNEASGLGGGMSSFHCSTTVTNCSFRQNSAGHGGAMANLIVSSTVTNCTFGANSAMTSGGGMHNSSSSPVVTNCILWCDAGGEIVGDATSVPVVQRSDIQGCGGSGSAWNQSVGTDAGGNLDADPLFANAGAGDLRLGRGSPCIDAAEGSSAPAQDIDGNTRYDDPATPNTGTGTPAYADIGASEFTGIANTTTTQTASTTTTTTTSQAATTTTAPSLLYVNDATWGEINGLCTASGDDANDGLSPGAPMRHVQAILDKYPAAGAGSTIRVDPGTYTENLTLGKSHAGLTLQGAGADRTIIDGGAAGSCIRLDSFSSGAIAFFTFRNGDAPLGGGIYCNDSSPIVSCCVFTRNKAISGGGMFNNRCFATITDSSFCENDASEGGGMFNNASSPYIANCTFTGHSGSLFGGGMYNGDLSSPLVANCTFSTNEVGMSGGGMCNLYRASPVVSSCVFNGNAAMVTGGGMSNSLSSSPRIANCTFFGNSALGAAVIILDSRLNSPAESSGSAPDARSSDAGGGICVADSSLTITNCVLWGNSGGEITQNGDSTSVVANCNIQGCGGSGAVWEPTFGADHGGNIDADPLFVNSAVGDFHLQAGSPCIDAADGSAAPPLDKDGRPRHDEPGVMNTGTGALAHADIGAYEFQGTPASLEVRSTTSLPVAIASGTGHHGATCYVKNTLSGTSVSLEAPPVDPAGYLFSRWVVNGAGSPAGAKSVTFPMLGPTTTAVACYNSINLTVRSTTPMPVPIGSMTGHSGSTQYIVKTIPLATPVSLCAPETDPAGYVFSRWLLNGEHQSNSQKVLNFSMSGTSTAVALYTPMALTVRSTTSMGVLIGSTTGHGGTTQYTVQPVTKGTNVQLSVPDSDPAGYIFSHWLVNGVAQTPGVKAAMFSVNACATAVAVYGAM